MTNIVPFPSAQRQRQTTGESALNASGEKGTILLFTGVRYERHSDPAPTATADGARGRGNDPRSGRKPRRLA
jgi:hypothetical protein